MLAAHALDHVANIVSPRALGGVPLSRPVKAYASALPIMIGNVRSPSLASGRLTAVLHLANDDLW